MTFIEQENLRLQNNQVHSPISFRQKAILTFIYDYTRLAGHSPALREIGGAVGITSSSHISYHVERLLRWSYLGRNSTAWRSLVLLQPAYDIIGQQPIDQTQITLSELRDENRRLREWCEQLHRERDQLHDQLEHILAEAG